MELLKRTTEWVCKSNCPAGTFMNLMWLPTLFPFPGSVFLNSLTFPSSTLMIAPMATKILRERPGLELMLNVPELGLNHNIWRLTQPRCGNGAVKAQRRSLITNKLTRYSSTSKHKSAHVSISRRSHHKITALLLISCASKTLNSSIYGFQPVARHDIQPSAPGGGRRAVADDVISGIRSHL
jgi:hypothetical protein